jgi:hypothetical protein
MRRAFLSTLTSIITLATWGQNLEKFNESISFTHEGTITFNDDSELQCTFTYNPLAPEGMLLVKDGDRTETLGVTIVKSFSFYDNQTNARRYYYSLPIRNLNNSVVRKYFVELIHGNKVISILGKPVPGGDKAFRKAHYTVDNEKIRGTYLLFLLDHRDGKISLLSKEDILRLTIDKKKTIKQFTRENHINLPNKKVNDYIKVIEYYSELEAN